MSTHDPETAAKHRVGIFGGTFDPIHFGHLRAASEAKEQLGLKNLRILPAGTPPHRSGTHASASHRLAMVQLALRGQADLWADDREVKRTGYSYMVDTLQEIREEEPDAPLLLLIGQDAANGLDTWHEWRRIFSLAHLVILTRPHSAFRYSDALHKEVGLRLVGHADQLGDTLAGRILPLEVTQLSISSTEIRQQIATGRSPRFLLPADVLEYIQHHGLYRAPED